MEAEGKTHLDLSQINRKDKFTGTVVKTMLAGAIIDIGLEVPGVIHISQLQKDPVNKVEDVLQVGQTVDVWVKRVFPKKKRIELTMIEPLPLEWREIKEGMVVKGTVTRLEKYGAFVDVGAERPGLVHISELAHGFIRTPEEAVQVGDEIEAKVLSVNRRRKQIKLSVKALMPDPTQAAKEANRDENENKEEEIIPTAMELALRQAMERSQNQNGDVEDDSKKKKNSQDEALDNILSRTLEQKVQVASE